MSEEDPNTSRRKSENPKSQSDTQGDDQPIDMEGQEDVETSAKVNEDKGAPDGAYEDVDENID